MVRPILFNGDMVQAILEGHKTVTRRIIKQDKISSVLNSPARKENPEIKDERFVDCLVDAPYRTGDILYVRETWQYLYELDGNEQIIEGTGRYYYAASDIFPFDTYVDSQGISHHKIPWRPSIHMPKEAARIWLKVTNVKAERLQNMDAEAAWKEGARCTCMYPVPDCAGNKAEFIKIWDSTILKKNISLYGWDANPWVWVIEFERCEKPEEVSPW